MERTSGGLGAVEGECDVTLTSPRARGAAIEYERGTLIGRYVILERVGAGGMGVVFAAYDPELDRKIALKLLARRGRAREGERERERLRREAQALAKLDHPNVVAVYDVGVHGTEQGALLFVAMEFVRGPTLRAWMNEGDASRSWREILRVLGEAGRGLAAAHEAGLIHRDFKPDNVMLGEDGRVRVMDFGLAREDEDVDLDLDLSFEDIRERAAAPLIDPLTQTGSLLGTPAYMAPEQLGLGRAGPRADQFSFCVTLYEALYGERPFAGQTFRELHESIELGRVREAPRGSRVPLWLRRVLLRGLAHDPRDRHASMQALLEALAHDPWTRRRRVIAGLGLAVAFGLGAWGLHAALGSRGQACADMERELEGTWDGPARARAAQAFEATGLSYAPRSWAVTQAAVDDYAQAWVRARTEACEATQRGTQSGEALDLRMACLDERREHLRAVVELLTTADVELVERGPQLVAGLPGLERCADVDALRTRSAAPEDPELAAAVRELDGQLARSEALELAGRSKEASALAERVLEGAADLGHEPLLIRAELRVGGIENEAGQVARAAELLEHAYRRALALGMLDAAARASVLLVRVNSFERATWAAATHWTRDAEALVEATGDGELEARLCESQGLLAQAQGDHRLARVHFAEALALREGGEGLERLAEATTLSRLATVTSELGELDRAQAYTERSLALREALLGADHPVVSESLLQLGDHALDRGAFQEALALYQQAFDILARSFGAEDLRLVSALNRLAIAHDNLGDLDRAQAIYERALAIATRAGRRDQTMELLNNLGGLYNSRGDVELALDHYTRALALCEELYGLEHFDCGTLWSNVGVIRSELGDEAGALEDFERARQICEAAVGPEHPFVATILLNSGASMIELGMTELGRANLERSLEIYEANELWVDVAQVATNLALVAFDEDRVDEARSLLERAQELLEAEGAKTPLLAFVLAERGDVERMTGRLELARALLERAVELHDREGGLPAEIANARFYLAQLLWDLPRDEGRDRKRARALATSARELFTELGEVYAEDQVEVTAWLRARGR